MIRANIVFVLFLFCLLLEAKAQVEGQIKFNGQNAETLKLEKLITVIRPVAHQVPGTCTRQIPEQQHVCRDVTRYKEECRWVPADTNCWTENEQVCRSVTRYRDECHQGPSRQVCARTTERRVCHDRPDRRVCRQLPDREICQDRPDREVCSERTGQRVCSTIPGGRDCKTVDGGEDCHYEDGGQDCHTEGGDLECQTIPGEEICRQVSYQDQDCDTVPRQRCEDVPAHNECVDVPYTQNVCGNETVYRTESYACMKTEMKNEPVQKLLTGTIAVEFKGNNITEEIPMTVAILGKEEMQKPELAVKLQAEPQALVLLQKKEVKVVAESEKEIRLEGNVAIELQEVKVNEAALPQKLTSALISEDDTRVLKVFFKGEVPKAGSFELTILKGKKVLATLKEKVQSMHSRPIEQRKKQGIEFNLNRTLKEELDEDLTIDLKLMAPMTSFQGEILNAKKPESAKEFRKIRLDYE